MHPHFLRLDPTCADWIAVEEMYGTVLGAIQNGAEILCTYCAERVGVTRWEWRQEDITAASERWSDALAAAVERVKSYAPPSGVEHDVPPKPVMYREYLESYLASGLISICEYDTLLRLPVITALFAIAGVEARHRNTYRMAGDIMAVIAQTQAPKRGGNAWCSEDFYPFTKTTPQKKDWKELAAEIDGYMRFAAATCNQKMEGGRKW